MDPLASPQKPLRVLGSDGSGWTRHLARRSGQRPLPLVGRVFLEAQSRDAGGPVRHVIKVIELSDGGFAFALEQWAKDAGVPYASAGTAAAFEGIVAELRSFDAAAHVSAEISMDRDLGAEVARVAGQKEFALRDYAETLSQIIKPQ